MKKTWIAGSVIVSPLGKTTVENYTNITRGISGLQPLPYSEWSKTLIVAGQVEVESSDTLTRFENLCCQAINRLLEENDFPNNRALFILSSTKGNIGCLENGHVDHPRLALHATAAFLKGLYGFKDFLVVSNACISGVLAMIVAKRFLQAGKYDHAVVLGADTLSHFVVSGFQSLNALSDSPCRPFDAERKGINLGEAAGAVLLSTLRDGCLQNDSVSIAGTGISNDANHISGPSRTGEELSSAMLQAIAEASCSSGDIDFISSHGTATLYNDEMEAKAFCLSGMQETPVNSLKGYFGHTLGAAGLIETIISMQSLLNNELIPTKGFNTSGVTQKINVIKERVSSPLHTCLKSASGFGGCNATLILKKEND